MLPGQPARTSSAGSRQQRLREGGKRGCAQRAQAARAAAGAPGSHRKLLQALSLLGWMGPQAPPPWRFQAHAQTQVLPLAEGEPLQLTPGPREPWEGRMERCPTESPAAHEPPACQGCRERSQMRKGEWHLTRPLHTEGVSGEVSHGLFCKVSETLLNWFP